MLDESTDRERDFSQYEKSYIREQLRAFMRAHPARVPLYIRTLDRVSDGFMGAVNIAQNPRLQFASAALLFVTVAGSGTAFAAQSALPGDPLYGIKVNVEEPIQGAFADTPQAQAQWNAELADRRLSEAETLAAQNKLTPAAASTVVDGLDTATENFDSNVAELATSSDSVTAAGATATMEATLAANTQVMTEIESAVPSAVQTLAPILAGVRERAVSLNNARTALDAQAAASNSSQIQADAEAQLDAAQGQLSGVEALASSSADTQAAQTQDAQAAITAGQQNLAEGNYVTALETLQAASLEANEAQINISAQQQLQSTGVQLPQASSTSAISTDIDLGSSTATSTSATATSSAATATSTQQADLEHADPSLHN